MTFVLYSYVSGHWNQIKTILSWMQILTRPKNTTSKTAFILYINVLKYWNRIKNGLVLKVDFEHPTCKGDIIQYISVGYEIMSHLRRSWRNGTMLRGFYPRLYYFAFTRLFGQFSPYKVNRKCFFLVFVFSPTHRMLQESSWRDCDGVHSLAYTL